ncbi:hypothetical protein CH333_08750 [candidate division WOR-3 bacterium JGI_Cruoil_03_44_89]|mgnify:CR=1 FL=1|uniref:Uncharacterized protein n=1 Tax=candidate division WOR-3 bacterium JGI_Cruoil_03_44_89 TaxID=1973748 RepID=A0A235BRN4_UNCW3|nr:MAG: hypothetical protein CH333_08750 [candidate division WOR-3 bacterium JGI_Cruoil_03_44_89]
MGGLAARAAIKFYKIPNPADPTDSIPVNQRVRKLLMAGTPNHPYDHTLGEWIYEITTDDKDWQRVGEVWEMDVESEGSITFRDTQTGQEGKWCDLLGYENLIDKMATISGNKGRFGVSEPNDRVVTVAQVQMSSAQFNPTIYAQHSYDRVAKLALPTCTYTTEFIKKWVIDDDISHNGAYATGGPTSYPNCWPGNNADGGAIRIYSNINNYNLALITLVEMVGSGDDYLVKAFPIYQYTKDCPGDPVLIINPNMYTESPYYLSFRIYDMDGLIKKRLEVFNVKT